MTIEKKSLEKIIKDGDTKSLVEEAEKFGKDLAAKAEKKGDKEALSTSQLRNFFGTVKKIEARGKFEREEERELLLLKPKLAYAAKRAGNNKLSDLKGVLTAAIDMVVSEGEGKEKKFKNFCELFEAILCYHKAAGGK